MTRTHCDRRRDRNVALERCRLALPAGRKGVTLLELVVSLVSAGVLVAGLSSSILIAIKACDSEASPAIPMLEAATGLTEFQNDLQFATTITENAARSVTVLVPDRNGDGLSETIRYAWSGVTGAAITRQINAGQILPFADNVADFSLEYEVQTIARAGAPVIVESGETSLSANTSNPLFSDSWRVTSTSPGGQFFEPSLPANTRSWRVTQVRIRAARGDSPYTETTRVALQPADANGLPIDQFVESQTLLESQLTSSYVWQTLPFSATSGLLPTQQFCLTLASSSTDGACRLHFRSLGFDGGLLKGNGTAWYRELLQTLSYEIRGTITTSTPTSMNVPVVAAVRVRWRPNSAYGSAVYSAVPLVNLPQRP